MKKSNLPPPSFDPLAEDTQSSINRDPLRQEPQIEEESHDILQKGMPGRNFKTWAVGTLGIIVIAALLWPSSDKENNNKKDAKAVEQSIADELASRVPARQLPEMVIEAPESPPPAPTPVPEKNNNDERMAMILASPMGAGVDLRSNIKAAPTSKKTSVDTDAMLREQIARLNTENTQDGRASKQSSGNTHLDFIGKEQDKIIEPALGLANARKPHTLYEGTLIRTVLTRALRTDLPGRISAKVMSDVYDSVTMNTLLIPRGSEITCSYQSDLLVGQEVVLAACNRLRLPNGKSFSLLGTPAADLQGASGLPADVNNHFWKMFGTAFVLGAVSLFSDAADKAITIKMGNDGSTQMGGNIVGTTLYSTIQQILQRNSKIPPTATVDIGTPFTLTISRDVEMEPYMGR